MTISIVNLTPHDVTVFTGADQVTFPATGVFARLAESRRPGPMMITESGDVPVEEVRYHGLTDLPEPAVGIAYLVSRVVAAESDREDLFFPSGELRDDQGRIIGCRALGRFSQA